MTSPIVINMLTKELLADETVLSFEILNIEITKTIFVTKYLCYRSIYFLLS